MTNSKTMNYDSVLYLAMPLGLLEDVADFLLCHPEWASGFSIIDAQGMGQGAVLSSAIEKVQGRSKRKLIMVVGEMALLKLLIASLGEKMKNSDIAYWIAPVTDFGRL
jgi:hypothetical protein